MKTGWLLWNVALFIWLVLAFLVEGHLPTFERWARRLFGKI